jgi:hypothetical protein
MSLIETDFLHEECRRRHRRHRKRRKHCRHRGQSSFFRPFFRPGSGEPGGAIAQSGQHDSNNAVGNLVDNTDNSTVNVGSFFSRARREFPGEFVREEERECD